MSIRNFFQAVLIIISIIIVVATLFLPVMVAILTANWWFLFLWFVVPIPLFIEILFIKFILEVFTP
jgi:hypothetical protein